MSPGPAPKRVQVPVVYDDRHRGHDPAVEVQCGVPIPMFEAPARADSIHAALAADGASFEMLGPAAHGTTPVANVHDEGLVRFLQSAWDEWQRAGGIPGAPRGRELIPDTVLHPALREGMGPAREPTGITGRIGYWCWETMTGLVAGSFDAACAAADVALSAADLTMSGRPIAYALTRPPGHHSPRAAFGGYCLFNFASVAAAYMRDQAGCRVAVLDVDYHHGNGTQQIFYQTDSVLYVSLHADPARAYPYFAGWPEEVGSGAGKDWNRNYPLPPGCDDERYLATLDQALDLVAERDPELLVVSLGLDTYAGDPIADFKVTADGFFEIGKRVTALDLPMVVVQEGGYCVEDLGTNVRRWLHGALSVIAAPVQAQ
jgi:acetoin utilization deacetylase AcuC-like enzyme